MNVLISFSSSSSSPTPTPSLTRSSSSTTSTPLLTNERILDDTSIAAVNLSNGNRRLFFQDHSGDIRQASYTSSSKNWRAEIEPVVASDAKNYTPISAFAVPSENCTVFSLGCLSVFYILANNSLAWKIFDSEYGQWYGMGYLSKYVAAADSRYLSSAYFWNHIMLVYESSEGGVVYLNASFTDPEDWVWKDVSKQLQDSNPQPGLQFSAPFTFASCGPADRSYIGSSVAIVGFASKKANGSYSEVFLTADYLDVDYVSQTC